MEFPEVAKEAAVFVLTAVQGLSKNILHYQFRSKLFTSQQVELFGLRLNQQKSLAIK